MAFILVLTPEARKKLSSLEKPVNERALAVFEAIMLDPFSGNKLSGKKLGFYSVRVWPYRIIYTIEKRELIVIVVDVDDRKNV